jgi:hypothetical protein
MLKRLQKAIIGKLHIVAANVSSCKSSEALSKGWLVVWFSLPFWHELLDQL